LSVRPLLGNGFVDARGEHGTTLASATWLDGRVGLERQRWGAEAAALHWVAPYHNFVLTEHGSTAVTRVRVDGRRVYDGRDRPGVLSVFPAGAERVSSYRHASIVFSALWVDPALEREWLREEPARAKPELVINGADAVAGALLAGLSASLLAGCDPGSLYVEHLVGLVLLRSRDAREAGRLAASALGRPALERVRDYVEANLGTELSLAALGKVAGLRADTLARQFKAATGLSLHAYVLERRVARAERQLEESGLGIADIALECGFSSQSHLTSTFRRLRGTTPRLYRSRFAPGS
jgi:AraC family transcriptional regulator